MAYGITKLRRDPELYRQAGYTQQQVAAIEQFHSVRSEMLALWLTALVVMFGYLVYVRRYFAGRPGDSVTGEAVQP